jgi:mono/diheme cytochrome c family protein
VTFGHDDRKGENTMTKTTTTVAAVLVAAGGFAMAHEGGGQRQAQRVSTATLYLSQCASCHGPKGEGQPGVRPLNGSLAHGDRVEDIEKVIRDGIKDTTMQAYKGTLTDAQIKALAEFVDDMSQ